MFKEIIAILILFSTCHLYSQNTPVVLNKYTAVSNIAGKSVTVTSASDFSVGDKVLIIQMQGATINTTNSTSFGDIVNYNNAGNYEFSEIASINGNTVNLKNFLCKAYSSEGKVQLIKLLFFNGAVLINETLTCKAWDGATGGVLVLESNNLIAFDSSIDVSGNGFRGGAVGNGFSCNSNAYATANGAGIKGEGIALINDNQKYGGGHAANGGGGSFAGNAGGSGGANYGDGGIGGKEYDKCGTSRQGIKGQKLDYSVSGKIFMGGGGGGGQQDNGGTIYPGGNGGGIVILKAPVIRGLNKKIIANGSNVVADTKDEGGAGGGAGGTVMLLCNSVEGSLEIQANGGDGNSNFNQIFTADCHGPGGGGGGGLLGLSTRNVPPNIIFTARGGKAGKVLNPSSFCYNTTHGATDGAPGGTVFNISLPLAASLNLGNDTILCPGEKIIINAPSGFTNYLWSTGSTNSSITITSTGKYTLQVTNASGCKAVDTIEVEVLNSLDDKLGRSRGICKDSTILLNAGNFKTYLWQDGSNNRDYLVTKPGIYQVTVTIETGCSISGRVSITAFPEPTVYLGKDTAICFIQGADLELSVSGSWQSYLWKDNSTNPVLAVAAPGNYWVTAVDNNGCKATDTIIIKQANAADCNDRYEYYIPNAFSPDNNGNNDIFKVILRNFGKIEQFNLSVYNRWGQKIFSSNTSSKGWDGKINGREVAAGSYIWSLRIKGNSVFRKPISILQKGLVEVIK
jgi:gliding motility-associated-like protein